MSPKRVCANGRPMQGTARLEFSFLTFKTISKWHKLVNSNSRVTLVCSYYLPLLVRLVYQATLSLIFLSRDEATEWSLRKLFWMLEKGTLQFVSVSRYGKYYRLRTLDDIVLLLCFMYPSALWSCRHIKPYISLYSWIPSLTDSYKRFQRLFC